jgi:hypothetical protein
MRRFTIYAWYALCIFLSGLFLNAGVACSDKQGSGGVQDSATVRIVSGDVTVLMSDHARFQGEMQIFNPDPANLKRFWVENWNSAGEYFEWTVIAPEEGQYNADILIAGDPGVRVEISGQFNKLNCSLQMPGWDKLAVSGELKLRKGSNRIILKSLDNAELKLKSVELISVTDKAVLDEKIRNFRSDTHWMADAGYGLMVQWGGWGYPKHGPKKEWPKMIDDFDVVSFAGMVQEMGASYVVWSATWITYHFPAPVKAIDKILPGRTSGRDLIGDLANELHKRGIRLILYYHLGHGPEPNVDWWNRNWVSHDDMSLFFDNFCAITTEVGERYAEKLSGWMIDDGMIYYPAPFERLGKALKAGNPERLIAYNSWVMPRFTEFQDFFFGEGNDKGIDGAGPKGGNGLVDHGPQKGLQGFACFIMDGPDWGIHKPETVINKPLYSKEQLEALVKNALERKFAMSFNLLMYEDGSVSPESFEMMKYIKSVVRGK